MMKGVVGVVKRVAFVGMVAVTVRDQLVSVAPVDGTSMQARSFVFDPAPLCQLCLQQGCRVDCAMHSHVGLSLSLSLSLFFFFVGRLTLAFSQL